MVVCTISVQDALKSSSDRTGRRAMCDHSPRVSVSFCKISSAQVVFSAHTTRRSPTQVQMCACVRCASVCVSCLVSSRSSAIAPKFVIGSPKLYAIVRGLYTRIGRAIIARGVCLDWCGIRTVRATFVCVCGLRMNDILSRVARASTSCD